MPGWSDRVRIVGGERGYAYRPGTLIVATDDLAAASALLAGIRDERIGEVGDYSVLRFDGDVPSAVALLVGAGLRAQPNHVFFADAEANPAYGNPAYGNPAYGNPAYGNPAYGNPAYGNPAYGNPAYGNPAYGNPAYGNPAYGNPAYGNPVLRAGCGCGCGPIGFVPTCPGGDHCCDTNPCTCEPAGAAMSLVYPHPVYAPRFYPATTARVYQMTGLRPTSARPVYEDATVHLPGNVAWDAAAVRVLVIDTGWPRTPTPPGAWTFNASVRGGTEIDLPDSDGDGHVDPCTGHGMFIAGIIAQYAGDRVAVEVDDGLHPEGDGDEATLAQKILDAVARPNPPHVLSLSWGTYTFDTPGAIASAITRAIARGIVVVASAGNDAVSRRHYPAALPGVVSVAALGPNGPAPFSNWGDWVRACAPGVDVVSGFWGYDSDNSVPPPHDRERFERWAAWSGTSFAAPIVAAVLARELATGASAAAVVARVIDHPRLYRIPCFGTVVNPGTGRPVP